MNHIKLWLTSVLCSASMAVLSLELSPASAQTDAAERAYEFVEGHRPDRAFIAMDETRLIVSGRRFVGLIGTQLVSVLDLETAEITQQIEDRRVVVSTDGLLMATYDSDGSLELRDIATAAVLHDLSSLNGNRTEPPVFSPDSTLLLAGWRGDRAVVIDVASGEVIEEYRNGSGRHSPVGFSADGRFAVITDRGSYVVFDRDTARITREFETPGGWSDGQLDGQNQLIVISEGQDYLSIVPLDRSMDERRVPLSRGGYLRVVLNDESSLAAVRSDREVAVVDLVAEAHLFDAETHFSHRNAEVAFSPDSDLLAVGRSYGTVTFLDARSGAFRGEYTPDHSGELRDLTFVQNGTQMLSVTDVAPAQWPISLAMAAIAPTEPQICFDVDISNSFDPSIVLSGDAVIFSDQTRTLRRISPVTQEVSMALDGFDEAVGEIGLSGDGRFLFAQLASPTVEVRNMETGARVSLLGTHPDRLQDVRVMEDGTRALTMDSGGVAALWDVATGRELTVFNQPDFPMSAIAFSYDGQIAAVGSGRRMYLYATADGEYLERFSFTTEETVSRATFLPDGALLTTFEEGSTLIVVPGTRELLASYQLETTSANHLMEISPDATHLAHRDYADIVLRDLFTGAELQRLSHGTVVEALHFSADGRRLLTASGDGAARLWDVATGAELARYVGPRGRITSIAFLPNEAGIASAANDDQLCFYGPLDEG